MITPILKDLKAHGGTLYTFPSASRDLTRSFTNSDYEFAFSHFACLNLPDFRYGKFKNGDLKGIYLEELREDCIAESIYNFNRCLKWHIQSYVMNFEVAILNGLSNEKYDNEILRNPSERIFFNWLQKVGAIRFGVNSETLNGYGDDVDIEYEYLSGEEYLTDTLDKTKSYRIGNKLYVWKGGEWKGRVLVSNTVQYIGTIDMINNVNIDNDSFNEIYLNIPASAGRSTNVYFNNISDNNYAFGKSIEVNNDYIIGRDPSILGMEDDITLEAIYDNYELGVDSDEDNINRRKYFIDNGNGYCINFSDNFYGGGKGIETMNLESEDDFEFNCVLIYYKIRKGDGNWYTNLYGVLFLEDVIMSDYSTALNYDDERGGYIQRYPKFKKGNSWGLKLDLKIDAQPDSQLVIRDSEYEDPNKGGVGMQMFTEALMQLNDCSKLFYGVKKENSDIKERLNKLENIVTGIDSLYDLRNEVYNLSGGINNYKQSIYVLDSRIGSLEDKIEELEKNIGYLITVINDYRDIFNEFI